jgi:hypothetical protein
MSFFPASSDGMVSIGMVSLCRLKATTKVRASFLYHMRVHEPLGLSLYNFINCIKTI